MVRRRGDRQSLAKLQAQGCRLRQVRLKSVGTARVVPEIKCAVVVQAWEGRSNTLNTRIMPTGLVLLPYCRLRLESAPCPLRFEIKTSPQRLQQQRGSFVHRIIGGKTPLVASEAMRLDYRIAVGCQAVSVTCVSPAPYCVTVVPFSSQRLSTPVVAFHQIRSG